MKCIQEGYMFMSNLKGVLSFVVITAVIIALGVFLYGIQHVGYLDKLVEMKTDVDVFVKTYAKSSDAVGIFKSKSGGYSFMEIFGTVNSAENYADYIQNDYNHMKSILESLERVPYFGTSDIIDFKRGTYGSFVREVILDKNYNIDPLIVMALMRVENANFNERAESECNALGLMQIVPFARECKEGNTGEYLKNKDGTWRKVNHDICVKYCDFTPADTPFEVNEEEYFDPYKNICCGIRILLSGYSEYKNGVLESDIAKTSPRESVSYFDKVCSKSRFPQYREKYTWYKGWDAAYRSYNGWGCDPEAGADVNYVEKVKSALLSYTRNQEILSGTQLKWPVDETHTTISSPFGYRKHPITGEYKKHEGIDIAVPVGTSVYASADGTVFDVYDKCKDVNEGGNNRCNHGYGNWVIIEHEFNGRKLYTIYFHLDYNAVNVETGDTVECGQTIAKSGNTGFSSGPHLHFEVDETITENKDASGDIYYIVGHGNERPPCLYLTNGPGDCNRESYIAKLNMFGVTFTDTLVVGVPLPGARSYALKEEVSITL